MDVIPKSRSIVARRWTKVSLMCNLNDHVASLSWYVTHFSSCETKKISTGDHLYINKSTNFDGNILNKFAKYSVTVYRPRPDEFGGGDGVYVLEINFVDFDDAGEYICRESADNVNDPDSVSIKLTVVNCTMREGKYYHN